MINKGLFTSNTSEWATPQDFFNKLNEEFHFTLDPCSNHENAKCKKHFTEEQDGLRQSWDNETVFCNPPHGKVLKDWVRTASAVKKRGGAVVRLIPASTDTRHFHEYIYQKPNVEIRFIKGRLKFGGSKNSAPFPSMLVIFR